MVRYLPLVLLAALGCAPRAPAGAPRPVDLAALDARRVEHAGEPAELTDVGVAYYEGGAHDRAREVLLAARALDPRSARVEIYLGLTYEALHQPDEAMTSYRRALGLSLSRRERQSVEARIGMLTREVLAAEARRAIAGERTLGARTVTANSVAVLPWTYLGADSSLRPLERGLAHLVVTDLSKVSRLTLLERERVQALQDELALAGAGRVDSATAARSGRLLGVTEVIQGAFRETEGGALRLDAQLVSAATASVRASGSASDKLPRLFAMEKQLVFALLDRWGIAVTPAERRAIAEQATADMQAFLAFSRALESEDRGDFAQASRQYQEAVQRDPAFQAAQQRSSRLARVEAARRRAGPELPVVMARAAVTVRSAQLESAIQNIAPSLAGRLSRTQLRSPLLRSRLAEALRQDDPSRLGLTDALGTIPRN